MTDSDISPHEIRERLKGTFKKCGIRCAPMPLPEMGRAEFVATFEGVSSKDLEPVDAMVILTYHFWDQRCWFYTKFPESGSLQRKTLVKLHQLLDRLKAQVEADFNDFF